MDALSSLKLMTMPQMTAGVNNPLQDANAAKMISPVEMQSLEAGASTQPANSALPAYSFKICSAILSTRYRTSRPPPAMRSTDC